MKFAAGLAAGWFSAMVAAQTVTLPQQPDEIRRRELEDAQRDRQRVREQQTLQAPGAGSLAYVPTPTDQPCLRVDAQSWLVVGTRRPVPDAHAALHRVLRGIEAGLAPACVHAGDARQLAGHVAAQLARSGYTLVQPIAMEIDASSQRVVLELTIPVVRRIELEREGEKTMPVEHLFGAQAVGDLFNSLWMDQAIENARMVPGADLLVRVIQNPDAPDELTLQALHLPGRRLAIAQEWGSAAATELHDVQAVTTVSAYRLFSGADSLQLSLAATPHDYRAPPSQRSSSADYTLAHGRWLLGLGLRQSVLRQPLVAGGQELAYESVSRNLSARLEGVVHRTPSAVLRVKMAIGKRSTDVALQGQAIDVQRRRLAQLSFGVGWRQQTANRYLDAELNLHTSPALFGAQPDFPEAPGQGQTASFRQGYYAASIYSAARLGEVADRGVQHEIFLQGQYARSAQYATDHFQIGPMGTVRGFAGRIALSGERGFLLRNDVSLPNCLASGFSCYVALDLGAIVRNVLQPQQQGALLGAAVGFKGGKGVWFVDMSVAQGLWQSSRLGPPERTPIVAARLGLRYAL